MMVEDLNTWERYQKLIVGELERLDRGLTSMHVKMDLLGHERVDEIIKIKVELATLKENVRMHGALAGAVFGAAAGIISTFISSYMHVVK